MMIIMILEDKSDDDIRYRDGAYRVTVWAALEDSTLQLENLFECEMFLPQTDFRLSKSTIYSPSKPSIIVWCDWDDLLYHRNDVLITHDIFHQGNPLFWRDLTPSAAKLLAQDSGL